MHVPRVNFPAFNWITGRVVEGIEVVKAADAAGRLSRNRLIGAAVKIWWTGFFTGAGDTVIQCIVLDAYMVP